MAEARELSRTFIDLCDDGSAEPVAVSRRLFAGDGAKHARLLGAVDFARPADLHASTEEMHPGCDEVLYLVSGALQVVLAHESGEECIDVEPGHAAIVPRGVWHRLVPRRPGRLLFINSRNGMETRRARTGESEA